MKMKDVKRAFTLVELLVVIAVLAILATVGIVGYTGFVNKANISNDTTVISELNTYIKASNYLEEINTVTDADRALEDTGFDLNKIRTSTKGYRYGYDVKQKEFCLIDKDWNLVNYNKARSRVDVFAFLNDAADFDANSDYRKSGYSAFLQDNFVAPSTVLSTNKGIDVGNIFFNDLFYTNDETSQSVVIYTNSVDTKIIIDDASLDGTIYHYGIAGYLDIVQCATKSYHEVGYIPEGQILKGRFINEVYNNDEAVGELKGLQNLLLVGEDEDSFSQIIVGAANGADIPDLERTDVVIPAGGVLVVEVQTGVTDDSVATDELIYLTKTGVIEQVVVLDKVDSSYENDKSKNVSSEETGVEGKQEITKDASEQISNLYKKNEAGTSYVDENGDDISVDELASKGVVEEEKPTVDDVSANDLFTGGAGTETNPYLIGNKEELRNISEICYQGACGNNRFKYERVYYKLVKDFSINDLSNYTEHGKDRTETIYTWYPALPDIDLDLNGHTISGINKDIFGYIDNLHIYNGTLSYTSSNLSGTASIVNNVFGDTSGTLLFENLSLIGELRDEIGAHYGPLVSYANNSYGNKVHIVARNITSSLRISNSSSGAYTGGLFGYIFGSNYDLEITNCTVSGVVQSDYAGGFVGGCTNPKSTICQGNVLNGAVLGARSASAYGTSAGTVDSSTASIGVASSSLLFDLREARIGDEIIINHTNSSVSYYVINICTYIHGSKDGIGGLPRYIKTTVNAGSAPSSVNTGMYVNKIVATNTPDSSKENILFGLTNDERMWRDGDIYYYYGGMHGQTGIITNPGIVYVNIYGYSAAGQLVIYQNSSYTHN